MKSNKLIKSFLALTVLGPSSAIIASCACNTSQEIAILFTNDIHATLENTKTNLGFAKLAGYRENLEKQGIKTILVDSGDYVQGSAYGTLLQGSIIIEMLNACKYDVVVPGNHEFDFGINRFKEIVTEDLNCPIISSNFYRYDSTTKKETTRVLDDTFVIEAGNKKIGFVGMTTPDALTTSNPKSFQDESGNYIYTFLGYQDPITFYTTVQNSINFLKQDKKCDYVFGLGHLGCNKLSNDLDKFTSDQVIKNTSGFDAILDGHSHAFMEATKVADKNGKDVYITQTGTQFQSIGDLRIKKDGTLKFDLVTQTDYINEDVNNRVVYIQDFVSDLLKYKLGEIDFDLRVDDGAKKPTRLVRKQECNCGDFFADALAFGCTNEGETKAPIAIVNGGAVRTNILKGDVTLGHFMELAPFCNSIARIEVSAKTLKDALEFSVHCAEKEEFGGFLQVSDRLHFKADLTKESPCILDGDQFVSVDETKPRRVSDITIDGIAIDESKTYELAGSGYILRDGGNGYTMFKSCKSCRCPEDIDFYVLCKYFNYCYTNKQLDKYRNVDTRITLTK